MAGIFTPWKLVWALKQIPLTTESQLLKHTTAQVLPLTEIAVSGMTGQTLTSPFPHLHGGKLQRKLHCPGNCVIWGEIGPHGL